MGESYESLKEDEIEAKREIRPDYNLLLCCNVP